MFQLCSVIFPTLITKGQIIKLLTQFTFTVKISAFHLERYRNGKTWCGWSKKYKKITISNSAQSFFQLWLPKYKLSIYRFTICNLWKFQLFILNGSEMASPCVKSQQKCNFFDTFQLCSVIFPTLITEGQIIKLLTQFTFTVKISAFHLERYRNGKTWCGWSKKYKKITISNSAQSFFQLWLPKYKLSIYRFTICNLWKFQLFILNGSEMASPCVKSQQKCNFFDTFQLCSVIFPTMITEVQFINLSAQYT